MNLWKNVLKKAIIVIQIALPAIVYLMFFDVGSTSGHNNTAGLISLFAFTAAGIMTIIIASILLGDRILCAEENVKKIVMNIHEISVCTIFAIFLFTPALWLCFSEIKSDDYIALEERISSSGDQVKEVVKSILKKDKELSGWMYMSILKELNRIDSIKGKEERDREMAKEKEEAKAALFKAIDSD